MCFKNIVKYIVPYAGMCVIKQLKVAKLSFHEINHLSLAEK